MSQIGLGAFAPTGRTSYPTAADGARLRYDDVEQNGRPFFHHAKGGRPIGNSVLIVKADAAFKDLAHKGKIAALSWQVGESPLFPPPRTVIRRRFAGQSQMAEVLAAIEGLGAAARKRASHVLLLSDSLTVVNYLAGLWEPNKGKYTRRTHDTLVTAARPFTSVQTRWVRTKPELAEVDRAGKKMMAKAISDIELSWSDAVKRVTVAMLNSPSRFYRDGQNFYDGFEVSLTPPKCTCPFWKNKLENLLSTYPSELRDLCKHMAVAMADAGKSAEEALVAVITGKG